MFMLRRFIPYAKEGMSTASIMATGDALAQFAIEKKSISEYEFKRTGNFAMLGFLLVGPSLRVWYRALDKLIDKQQTALKRATKKVLVDQTCFAPTFTIIFTSVLGTINGESPAQIEQRLRNDYIEIMKHNYMLWPAAQLINFSLVPLQYQVIFVQLVAVIWNSYLSTKLNHQSQQHTQVSDI